MDELEARLIAVQAEAIFGHLNNAARLVWLQHGQIQIGGQAVHFDAPEQLIRLYQDSLRASAARLKREIQSRGIAVSDQELTTYFIRATSDAYTEALKDFKE